MKPDDLVEMSNRYGKNEEYVLAGGGNTSFKENGVLYVKGSGSQLSDIKPEQFVAMDIGKLLEMIVREYPASMSDSEREKNALADMMAARLPGEEEKRPSVEATIHAMFPYKFVLHVHPPLINGMTCGKTGEDVFKDLFVEKAVWIDLIKPGLILAQTCNRVFTEYAKKTGKYPDIVILQNHGIFVAADTVEEIDKIMEFVVNKLNNHVKEVPCFDSVKYDKVLVDSITQKLKQICSNSGDEIAAVLFCTNKQVLEFLSNKESFGPISTSFTPDHIVYCKDEFLFIEPDSDIEKEFNAYKTKNGYNPKIAAVSGLGFFAFSENQRDAERAKILFLDLIKVAVYAKSFGGINPLPGEFTDFILNWEAEAYRSKV